VLTLYIWEENGGLCRKWRPWDECLRLSSTFFMFGRFGGGFQFLGKIDSEKTKSEATLAICRVTEKFGIEARVLYCKPPEGEE